MANSGSGEITLDVDTEPKPNKTMGYTSAQQEENMNTLIQRQSSAFSSKVKRKLEEILGRDDIPDLHKEKMRNLMNKMSSSSFDDVQLSGNAKMRELMERQFISSVDDTPFCDNMVHIMNHELYEAVCDKSVGVNKFVHVLDQVCTQNKVDLATIFFNQVTPTGDSLLHVAAQHGSEQVVLLIAFHYPKLLYKKNTKGDTPLHVAARAKNLVAIKNILDIDKHFRTSEEAESVDNEEFIMSRNNYGRTTLHEAILSKKYFVVLFLLVAHNQSDLTTYWTWNSSYGCKSPMYLAVLTGVENILHLILMIIPIPSGKAISNGDSPLHAAIFERNKVLLKMTIDTRQELLYERDENNNTPLHHAAYDGYTQGVRIMLEKSPMVAFQRNSDGDLSIHLACHKHNVKVVKELLENEWSNNVGLILNNKGQNIVHIAAMKGQTDVLKYLLKQPKIHDDSVNERDANGDTPLHLASRELRLWTLLLLSRHKKIDVNLVNNEGFTARDVVWMQCRIPMTRQEFLADMILYRAGTHLKANELGIQSKVSVNKEWNVKDATNILLIVAILIATVSFAAGFTVPGGFYNSDSSIAKEGGMAILSDQTLFKIFMAFDIVAMYSSTIASIILLWVPFGDPRLADRAYWHARFVVQVALVAMSIAFQAAIRLIVSNNTLLAHFIDVIGFIGIFVIIFFRILEWFPLGIRLPVFRQIADLAVWILVFISCGPSDVWNSAMVGSQSS